ncbi:MAG: hypothetical protein ACQESK_07175 [Bacteroidota bacterium]
MKKLNLLLIVFLFLATNQIIAQKNKPKASEIKYFDENYEPISKEEYYDYEKARLLSVTGDSIHHKIHVVREEHGKIENKPKIDSLLSLQSSKDIDPKKPSVIIYYPGKDPCNSSGSSTNEIQRNFYHEMELGINDIADVNILYVYKNTSGLFGKNDGHREWIRDPGKVIEKLFFKRHYSCSSFVVLSENGDYICYFGEFAKESVWAAVELIQEK